MISTRTTGRVSSVAAAMIAAAVLVAGATAPAYAAAGDPTTETVKPAGKADREKRYCVKPQVTTGTILAGKVCKTRDEWIAKTGVDPAAQK